MNQLAPGLAGFLQGEQFVQQRNEAAQQQQMRQLQMQQVMEQRAAQQQALQRDQQVQQAIAAANGDVERAMEAALKVGDVGTATKLAPLVEARRKAQAPRVMTPGSQLLGPNNEVLHQTPNAPARPEPQPEFVRLQEYIKGLPEGDPRRPQAERYLQMLTERGTQRPQQQQAPSGYRFKPDGSLEPIPGGPHATQGTGLSPDALELRARQYLSGDPKAMANLGRGNQGREVIVAITNRAAEILREQGGTPEEIGRRMAEFRANSNSLNKMTQSYDAIVAFEQTAVRNGHILKELAEKVDSTGVPVIERWIRAGRKEIAGDVDVARFNAQLQVYRTEAARILTNPNLSGQLTDSARKEVEEFLKGGASAAQIRGVVDLLERDFDNRKKTLEQQMQDIRGRLEKNISAGEKPKEKQRIRFDAQGNVIQ